MKIISFLFILLVLPIQISAQVTQEWVALHPVSANDITVDKFGNSYIATAINGDGLTIKYNSIGEIVWASTYNTTGNSNTSFTSIKVDSAGNVYVAGLSPFNSTNNDFITIKYNSSGVEQWVRGYNGPGNGLDIIWSIAIDNIGNVYVTGTSFGGGTLDDYATIKYNSDGIEQWVRRYNASNFGDIPLDIAVDNSGNVYVTGRSYIGSTPATANQDYATIKYNSAGVEQWVRSYNSPLNGDDYAVDLEIDNAGNIYVFGYIREPGADSDFGLVKYNSEGSEQWVKRFNGNADSTDTPSSMAIDQNNNIFVTGSSIGNGTKQDIVTIKYDSTGNREWFKIYNNVISNSIDGSSAIAVDDSGAVYVTGGSQNTITGSDYITLKYNSAGDEEWQIGYNSPENNGDAANAIAIDDARNIYVTGSSNSGAATIKYSQTQKPRYPVFIVPGVGATYSANLEYDLGWILKRGIEPDSLQIDPLGRVYDDLIITLENLGYVKGKDLFIANYDWRVIPGPVDNNIDGHIDGVSGTSITSGQFNFGVDYLGWFIKQACERWRQDHNEELDSIDIISHSTGGLVTRTYIQSDAYGGVYDNVNNYRLPKIRNFIMIGVPNRGASKPWNPIHDNWTGDIAYRLVLSKIVNSAYQKVLQDKIVTGPDGNITKNSILDSTGTPNKELFINKYVPTIRYLLATYPFIDFGSGLITVNNDVDQRNTILLDLNNGFDINPLNDPNGFLDSAKVTVIYGTSVTTKSWVTQRSDFETFALQSFTEFTPSTAFPGNIWYKDIEFESNGDGTVPTNSSAGQFLIDTRANMIPFASGDHTGLVSQQNVQTSILDILNVPYNLSNISTGLSTNYDAVLSVVLDPVELVITDGNGNRFGYTNTSGALSEIPNSIWFGNTDGRGWVFGSVQEPINLQLTGLGENYYVMVSVEDSTKGGGVVLEGFLGAGEVINYQITLDPVSVEEISSVIPKNFMLAQNFPNPFNPSTTINWQSPISSHQTLKIYDVLGNEVATLVDEFREAGRYEITFDASQLASGIYLYKLQAGSFVETKKMILLR